MKIPSFLFYCVFKESAQISLLGQRLPLLPLRVVFLPPPDACYLYVLLPFLMIAGSSRPEFLNPGAGLMFWTGLFFVVGSCPVHCRVFRSISGLYPQDDCINHHHPHLWQSKMTLNLVKCPQGGKFPLIMDNTGVKESAVDTYLGNRLNFKF